MLSFRNAVTRRAAVGLFALSTVAGLASCAYNDELGRSQLLFAGGAQLTQAAASAWNDLKQQEKISRDTRYTSRLNRVAPKIITAAGGNPAEWEYVVFDSKELNAFALPGGKIGVYTGIMDIMKNDAQLAAVVGHEVAHVNYNHSAERQSQATIAQVGLLGAQVVGASQCSGAETRAEAEACQQTAGQWVQILGIGAMYGAILPYSRTHELEADSGGVRYMAAAGYDPREAINFWQGMAAATANSGRPPEFASTHPATDTRIQNLKAEVQRLGYSVN
ncbi:M48 family metallopeptidase [Parvularcula sp. LCG005]|uniref:M48 family metallopeptidase n=1 Tax=Parvularcula sp. LCG005 TaxID=3078805 RepID=UPI0029428ED7|nr:M48 family metallopeptidase [Parvularcula sp. LCG005]WOI54552.1 M48 family metallopeptidase [Parvularcula sp. LCG005]